MIKIQDDSIYLDNTVIGNINFYSLSKEDSLDFFVNSNGFSKEEFKKITKIMPSKFMVLEYIEIEKLHQNKGYATQVVQELIKNSNLDIVLIPNMDSEFIMDWYLNLGFEEITVSAFLPILIFRK